MKKVLLGSTMVVAMSFAVFNTTHVAAKEVTIKLVSMLPKKHPIGKSFNGFINRMNAKLKGEFQIDWRGGPEVVPQFKQPNAVRLGSVDATLTSPSYVNGILNVSGSANYSNRPYNEIKATGYHALMEKLHGPKGLVYVGELPVSQLRFHIFLKDPIQKLDDFKGMKIRVFPAIAPAVKALGANPVVLPMPQIYTAMERGVVKGFATGVSGVAKKYKGLIGAYTTPGFYRATFHFLMNPKTWAKVPAQTRKNVINFVRNTDPAAYEASWDASLKDGYAQLAKDGVKAVKFSAAEEAKFSKMVLEAAWAAVKAKDGANGPVLQKMLMN